MMKKLLIFMLVLGLASTANAALLELSIDGAMNGVGEIMVITLVPSEEITIDVYSNGPTPGSDIFWLGIERADGDGEWLTATATAYAAAGDAFTFGDGGYGADWFTGDSGMYNPETPPGEGKWFDVVFHCLGLGDVYINLYAGDGVTLEDSILVHQVPEPATMALLGLGGLFLRRRK